jgi:hypothetical protein
MCGLVTVDAYSGESSSICPVYGHAAYLDFAPMLGSTLLLKISLAYNSAEIIMSGALVLGAVLVSESFC